MLKAELLAQRFPDKIRLANAATPIDGHKLRFVGFNGSHQGLSLWYTTYHFDPSSNYRQRNYIISTEIPLRIILMNYVFRR